MLNRLRTRLQGYQPRRLVGARPQAGVLIALTDTTEPAVILTKRARGLSTHSGEVAFPGGSAIHKTRICSIPHYGKRKKRSVCHPIWLMW